MAKLNPRKRQTQKEATNRSRLTPDFFSVGKALNRVVAEDTKAHPCKRCGICCLTAVCSYGKESDDAFGVCIYLTFKENLAVCQLIAEGSLPEGALAVGEGCILQCVPQAYHYYTEQYGKLRQYLIARDKAESAMDI